MRSGDTGRKTSRRAERTTANRAPLRAASLLLLTALTFPLAGCDVFVDWPGGGGADASRGMTGCPRPPMADAGGFNDQERAIRYFRKHAFANDFFSQLELANRYMAVRATDKNLEDPIEASVWLVMALTNPEGFAPINRTLKNGQMASRFDKCRAVERANAYRQLERNLERMDNSERDKVRDRVIYIQAQLGADGFRTLGRLYDAQYGPMGEPADNREAVRAMMRNPVDGRPNVISLFQRNDVDAYLYNYKASETGDVGSYVMLKDFERSSPDRNRYGAFVEAKAKRWVAPYEFYPPTAPTGGVPHSDESRPRNDAYEYALSRMDELPFIHVWRALVYLDLAQPGPPPGGAYNRVNDQYHDQGPLGPNDGDLQPVQRPEAPVSSGPGRVSPQTLAALRGILGRPDGARLTNLDKVRAIQLAATNGSKDAQLVLAVMYSEGVGVPADYARAYYWYQEAEKQGSAEARFAMSTYFALGLSGVADQDKASAVVLRLDSALAGYKPSASRLQAVLAQVSANPGR
ncbi:tetratricopeptide repeat protein [Asticcacaulis sp. BYS171W]|uniref:Tetratricopeptide repeat protein n=1 Tax=Asticcacaulis aquaticus TaxID=2984212 RepID=A0ABT5HVK4_9CAUL|nr:tetratricopeptide repeat protein [Asticcacaulis aquaticus]MDC7684093.1 tetratricopeptide repeat protein [Asticcacaulis aquaticus]